MKRKGLGLKLGLVAALCSVPITGMAQQANPAATSAAVSSSSAPPPASSTVTTTVGGTAGKFAMFTTGTNIENALISQSGSTVSLGGKLKLPATGTATSTGGKNSRPEAFVASVFNSGTATAVAQTFQWQAEPANNNTTTAAGTLNLLYASGTAAPAETGLTIANSGRMTFAAGQTFPGTAGLATANTFTANQSITGNLSATGTIAGGAGSFTSLSAGTGTVTGNLSVNGNFGTSGNGTFDGGLGVGGGFSAGAGETVTGSIQFNDDDTSNLQPSLVVNAVHCCKFGNRMMWAHSPTFPQWGWYYDDAVDHVILQTSLSNQVAIFDFEGDLDLKGTLTSAAESAKIDHPLDPKNKYLNHASVESSEMMNIYTGNAILDNSGEGVVSLPKWFEALNTDYRYQLTAIGAAAPNLHVAQEIANHQFSIAGGAPGMKVSWQVTAVRHDPYAKTHPLVVEVKKSDKDRGHYMNPEAYGAPRLTQEQMLQQR